MSVDPSTLHMVKLISADGHEFYVHKKCAMVSGTIAAMLSGQFAESRGEVRFPEIPGVILEKVIQYMYYKTRYTNSTQRVPNFQIEPEISLELLMASNYLDC
jgi:transcription elongation factor B subunit 1